MEERREKKAEVEEEKKRKREEKKRQLEERKQQKEEEMKMRKEERKRKMEERQSKANMNKRKRQKKSKNTESSDETSVDESVMVFDDNSDFDMSDIMVDDSFDFQNKIIAAIVSEDTADCTGSNENVTVTELLSNRQAQNECEESEEIECVKAKDGVENKCCNVEENDSECNVDASTQKDGLNERYLWHLFDQSSSISKTGKTDPNPIIN